MEEIKKSLLCLDQKTVYLNDISKGEKIFKINNTLYKNSDTYLQGLYRFFLRESKETTLEYLNEIVNELIVIKQNFNNLKINTTYSYNNEELRTNDYNYLIQIFSNLKERFLQILNNYEATYSENIHIIKKNLINSLSSQ